jgi:hypothetical protein
MSRWTSRAALALLAVGSLAACGDGRLKKLSAGIAADSVAVLMEADAPHTMSSYLVDGKYWEVLMYPRTAATPGDSIAWREMSPVVMADGAVVGWGWSYLDETAAEKGFQVPAKE